MYRAATLVLLCLSFASAIAEPPNPNDPSPDEIRSAGQEARRTLYWQKKDLAGYVRVAMELLDTARRNFEKGGPNARDYGARVVGLSYDIASFTWPGWGEEGIEVTDALRGIGIGAADLNVSFCEEHELSNSVRARAHFILGAHKLAIANYDGAADDWQISADLSDEPAASGYRGWVALARAMKGGSVSELQMRLGELTRAGGESATTAAQIETALRVFHKE